jgi:hypothetical protein
MTYEFDECMLSECPHVILINTTPAECPFHQSTGGKNYCSLRVTIHELEMRRQLHPSRRESNLTRED